MDARKHELRSPTQPEPDWKIRMPGTKWNDFLSKNLAFIGSSLDPIVVEQLDIVSHVMVLAEILQDRNKRLAAACGLELQEMFTLYTIGAGGKHGPVSPRQLAEALSLNATAISKRLARLERDALIKRTLANHDKRKVVVRMTAAGRRVYERIRALESEPSYAFSWITKELSVAERRDFVDQLHRLLSASTGTLSRNSG